MSMRLSGTSWPITVPSSSTMYIVTSDGRVKSESQNIAATLPEDRQLSRPLHSRRIPNDTVLRDRSVDTASSRRSAGTHAASITPGMR
ncbi:MAG: hypothetical protein IJ026_04090 [Candidatus Methanomethylophilaceae archaeon]|nr:hypothetical protein [Candidatus Methanomethylophilaceae archaeon]